MKTARELLAPEDHDHIGYVLYRCYDASRDLLYIGYSSALARRVWAHRTNSAWWSQVDHVSVTRVAGVKAALAEERAAIEAEAPRYNVDWQRGYGHHGKRRAA